MSTVPDFQQLLKRESGEQEYEFKMRTAISDDIRLQFPLYNMMTCVILGYMVSKKLWLGITYDVEIEEQLELVMGRILT